MSYLSSFLTKGIFGSRMKRYNFFEKYSTLSKSVLALALGFFVACSDSGTSSDENGGSTSGNSNGGACKESAKECSLSLDENSICDSRDGQVYKTVKIGDQVWLAQNMNFCTTESWCYEGREENCQKYGRLYSWSAAMGLDKSYQQKYANLTGNVQGACPEGFHVASVDDWNELEAFAKTEAKASQSDVGALLRSNTNDWQVEYNDVFGEMGGPGNDGLGFGALPAGEKRSREYKDLGFVAYFWTANEDTNEPPIGGASNALIRSLKKNINDIVGFGSLLKDEGLSLRCVKD